MRTIHATTEAISEIFLYHLRSERFPEILKAPLSHMEKEAAIEKWALEIATDVLRIPVEGLTDDGKPISVTLADLIR